MELVNEEKLYTFFKNNFRGLIKDRELNNYIVNLMTEFTHPKKFNLFFDERGESVRFDAIYQKDKFEAYNSFKNLGDCYLWMCGFYPEYLSKNKKSKLGLKSYIRYGKTSYNHAVYSGSLIPKNKVNTKIISRASDNFIGLTRAIFDFRNKIDFNNLIYLINPDTMKEIKEVIYEGRDIRILSESPMLTLLK